jgi:hypothetical protein
MTMRTTRPAPRTLPRWCRPGRLATALAGVALLGCSDILEVNNPNNLQEENLAAASSARALAAGAAATVSRSIGAIYGPYHAVTDEVSWRGSRDAWLQLDLGNLADPANEFTDDAFRFLGEGRWMADEAVRRLEAFDAAGQLLDPQGEPDRTPLARSYLFAALSYMTIADMFDDFALSDRRDPAPPVGEAKMVEFYDKASAYLDKGRAIAQAAANADLENEILAARARAKYSRALWSKLHPTVVANGLVNDAGANADATLVLSRVAPDFRALVVLENDDIAYAGEASLAYNIEQRRELRIASAFSALTDPVTNDADPVVERTIEELGENYVYQRITVASAREMHLILAEAALQANDIPGFTGHINRLRALDGLTPWAGQIPALDMLKHSRKANLFLQGRRLADMYRFAERSPEWGANSTAAQAAGTFFPVTCIEIRSHPGDFQGTSC